MGDRTDLPLDYSKVINHAAQDWHLAYAVNTRRTSKIIASLAWEPPPIGQFKLNVDGSRKASSSLIGAGGVIRDGSGSWICGFAVNLGRGQILEAELWGLFFGLRMAVHKSIRRLIIEMDSACIVKLIQDQHILELHPLTALLSSCWQMMNQIENCSIHHIYRENNTVADGLANWSHNLDLGPCFLEEAPSWIGSKVWDDLLGVVRTRMVCCN
ncbi:hypothetical protein CerSpe_244940 [Prunus speciosa]